MSRNDPMAANPDAQASLAGPVRRITLVTGDGASCAAFYGGVMGMTEKPVAASPALQATQRRLWALEQEVTWGERLFVRPEVPGTPSLRVLVMDRPGPEVRPDYQTLLEGGLSVGFAVRDMDRAMADGKALGFDTTVGLTRLTMKRNDGTDYDALECHFKAPDGVYALGIGRPPDLAPVCPIPDGANVGGPGYTGQVLADGDKNIAFYRDVLGWEVRRDVTVTSSGPAGGLGLAPDTRMRFLQLFAPQSASAYVIFLQFPDRPLPNPVPLNPPQRGVMMWTFEVSDLQVAQKRLQHYGYGVLAGPEVADDPDLGHCRIITARAPSGFLIELAARA